MIRGLTTQKAYLPPVIGKLRKGGEKPANGRQPGKDLDHFRFTPHNEKDAKMLADFQRAYGDEPQRIEVYLPSDDVDVVFDAWQEEWSAAELKHRCDGEYIYQRNRATGDYERTSDPCPWLGKTPPPNQGCKQIGRLAVILPELVAAGHYGVVTVETHSLNDIATIHRALTDFRNRFGRLTGVPFYVYRYPEMVSTPSGSDGKRARREKWLVGITPATDFVQRQLEQARQSALTGETQRALPAPQVDEDGVIVEGQSAQVEMMTPDQWHDLQGIAQQAFGETWQPELRQRIYEVTAGRTTRPADLTKEDARAVFERIEDEIDLAGPAVADLTPELMLDEQ